MAEKHPVLIRQCEDYENLEKMRKIVRAGIKTLKVQPRGKVLLKPNLIFAHPRYGRYGFTNPRLVEAVIDVLGEMPEVTKITIGERTAVTVPTRMSFFEAGYGPLLKKPKVEVCFFDEAEQVMVPVKKGTVHRSLRIARALAEADFKLWMPKLKAHVSSKLTCAMKLNIGILDSKDRLNGHDFRLEEKIADLYEIGHPDLVVCDAIYVGQQAELVPKPLPVGIIMMGLKGLAVDVIGAKIIGLDPMEVGHIRIARERGWPPITDDEIALDTEVPWEEILDKTKNFDRSYSDPRELDTPLRFFLGPYPGGTEICQTGCTNMLKTVLSILEAYTPGSLKQARPVAVVIGEFDGDVDGQGHPILMLGDCAKIKGRVIGKTKKFRGCPLLVPTFMAPAAFYFGTPNPYFDLAAWKYPLYLAQSYINKFRNRGL